MEDLEGIKALFKKRQETTLKKAIEKIP